MKRNRKSKVGSRKNGGARKAMPKFYAVDEEMKHRASLLQGEVVSWPGVTTKPMFGMVSLFREGAIFAAVPKTRTLRSPQSIILKFDPMPLALRERQAAEPRLTRDAPGPGAGWHAFEVASEADIKDALWWLNQAYELAKK